MMPSRRRPADSKTHRSRESDDLTAIKGIGEARQRWFRESLGVRTYRQLAVLSTDEIESRLKAEKQTVSRSAIETWVGQARKLAGAEESTPIPKHADQRDWAPFASFVVEFQSRELEEVAGRDPEVAFRTAVHHLEADEDEEWPRIETELLSHWMLQKALAHRPTGGRVAVEPEERPAEEQKDAPRVEITEIQLSQRAEREAPRSISSHGQAFSASVKSDEPFAAEVKFELAGAASGATAREQAKYLVQLYAENLGTAAKTHLGDSVPVPVAEEKGSYSAVLPQSTLAAGVYRLTVLTRREGDGTLPDHLEAPLLRVV
jgi:hypothetical protein